MAKKKAKLTGFRVDLILAATGEYAEYTSLKQPVSRDMADSLSRHLERNQTGGRIVDFATGETVKTWNGKYPLKEKSAC